MPERRGIIPPCQDLPDDARASLDGLKTYISSMFSLPIVVLSYGRASPSHPDPTGEQLKRLLPFLQSLEAELDRCDRPESEMIRNRTVFRL